MLSAPHLLIAFAAQPGWSAGPLPQLARLLATWHPAGRDEGEPDSLSPPHERALARSLGWPVVDGLLPFAAPDAQSGWGWLTPVHWHAGAEQVTLQPPDALELGDADALAVLDAIRPLLQEDGWHVEASTPRRWRVRHASLAGLPTAALDRAAGRNVGPWLGQAPGARPFRRLQAEVQMRLHTHPLNAAREAAGRPAVNSVWLHGTGTWPAGVAAPAEPPAHLDTTLRAPALAGDEAAWRAAWQQLDGGPLARWAAAAPSGARLTLCGERSAATWTRPAPCGPIARLWQALRPPRATPHVLAGL